MAFLVDVEFRQRVADAPDLVIDGSFHAWMLAFGDFFLKVLVAGLDEDKRTLDGLFAEPRRRHPFLLVGYGLTHRHFIYFVI